MPDYGMRGNLHHSWAGERYANTGTRRHEGESMKNVKITAEALDRGVNHISVKIRVSYEKPQELQTVLELLRPVIRSYKPEKGQSGAYRRAYVEIGIPKESDEKP